jgi:hypothetical protein
MPAPPIVPRSAARSEPVAVEHGAHVVHALLERRQLAAHAVGEARPSLVEQDQPREGREALVEAGERAHLPGEVEVREAAGAEEQVGRPVADHLVRDVDVAGLRVPRPRLHAAAV